MAACGPAFSGRNFPPPASTSRRALSRLVDEGSGRTTWLQLAAPINNWQRILVRAPAGPFHVEAVVAAGANRPLAFSYPREVGWLSAWVDTILDASASFLFAGLVCWLGAIFWRHLEVGTLLDTGWQRVPVGTAGPATGAPEPFTAATAGSPGGVTTS